MRSHCPGQRQSLTVQLNLRPVRRIELYTKLCTGLKNASVLWNFYSSHTNALYKALSGYEFKVYNNID